MERFVYFAENTTLHGMYVFNLIIEIDVKCCPRFPLLHPTGWRYCVSSGRNLCHGVFWASTLCGSLMLSAWILSTDVMTYLDSTVSFNLQTLAGNLDEVCRSINWPFSPGVRVIT